MKVKDFRQAVRDFLDNGRTLRRDIVPIIIQRLELLREAVAQLPTHRFFSSSLLIVYDGHVEEDTFRVKTDDDEIDPPQPSDSCGCQSCEHESTNGLERRNDRLCLVNVSAADGLLQENGFGERQSNCGCQNGLSRRETFPTKGDDSNRTVEIIPESRLCDTTLVDDKNVHGPDALHEDTELHACQARVDVRMVDFAHSTFEGFGEDSTVHEGVDAGYLLGLQTLINIFTDI